MQLVVTEKPSVAQAISHVIGAKERKDGYMEGNGFLVSWCVGHLVELAQPEMYSEAWKKWSYESLPMIPEQWQHEVKKETATQYKILKNLMHDTRVESVVCATDAGREGELIFRLVYEQAGCRKPMKRLWISSMEESAIRDGFENLKPGSDYDSLYQSALCRQQADWLVGLNGTRLFTVLYGGKVLKVGRVQTPTLAMLVDREVKIMNFEKEQYYMAHILMDGIDAMTERIDDKARAESIAATCESQSGVVRSVIKENKSVAPPKLYDLIYAIIAIVGTITGNWIGMFSFLLPFTILRQYAGGIHLEKPMNCIIFSGFLVFGCGQYLAVASDIGKILCALWVAAILLIFVLAPIDTKGKKLDKTAKKIYGRRARGVLVIEVMIAICFWVCGFIVVTKGIAIAHIILMVSLITGKANFFDYR